MAAHLKPETESRLKELAATTGRAPDDLVEDAMAGYLAELVEVRKMLDGRYDEIKSGRVEPIDGEEAFDRLRRKSQDRRRSLGHGRPDLTSRALRFQPVRDFLIVYAPDEKPLLVIAVLHGHRNPRVLAAILRERK